MVGSEFAGPLVVAADGAAQQVDIGIGEIDSGLPGRFSQRFSFLFKGLHFALDCCLKIALRATELGYCLCQRFPQLRQFLRSKQNEGNQENDDHFLHADWSHTCPPSFPIIAKGLRGERCPSRARSTCDPNPADARAFRVWYGDSFRSSRWGPQCWGFARSPARPPAPAP